MGKLPIIPGKKVIKAFESDGWYVANHEGSHVTLKKKGMVCNLSIPVHGNKNVKRGLLRKQIAKSGLTVDEFVVLLGRK